MEITIQQAVSEARARLVEAGIALDAARIDAEVLARELLGWDQTQYLVSRDQLPPAEFTRLYEAAIARRARREPVAFITGRREFWGLDFEVKRAVLIPRPETECVIEEALAACDRARTHWIADVGTGSGCLAIALAREWSQAEVLAIDISIPALEVARRNAVHHRVADRVHCMYADGLPVRSGTLDLVVSNPPYVSIHAPQLMPELEYEPHEALFAPGDGLSMIRRVLHAAASALRLHGWLCLEFGYNQSDAVSEAVHEVRGLTLKRIRKDLQGIPRVAVVQRGGGHE